MPFNNASYRAVLNTHKYARCRGAIIHYAWTCITCHPVNHFDTCCERTVSSSDMMTFLRLRTTSSNGLAPNTFKQNQLEFWRGISIHHPYKYLDIKLKWKDDKRVSKKGANMSLFNLDNVFPYSQKLDGWDNWLGQNEKFIFPKYLWWLQEGISWSSLKMAIMAIYWWW